jgi:hypothetical protein
MTDIKTPTRWLLCGAVLLLAVVVLRTAAPTTMQLLFGDDLLLSVSIGTILLLRRISPSFSLRGQHSSTGISFQRTITTFPEDGILHVDFDDDHCTDSDAYGNNHCHYDWNEHVLGDYSILVEETLDEDAFVTGTFKVRNLKRAIVHFKKCLFLRVPALISNQCCKD